MAPRRRRSGVSSVPKWPSVLPPSLRVLFSVCGVLLLLAQPGAAIIPEFLSYKTCVEEPPSFSGCMNNVTADIGDRVVLNCQVDPRCVIQFLYWYHEDQSTGEKRLLKTGKSSNDPYFHTINSVLHKDLGRYTCVIGNVMGKRECEAHLTIRSAAPRDRQATFWCWIAAAFSLALARITRALQPDR